MTMDDVRHGPLEDLHRDLGAKLGPFGGWLMPIEYAGTLSEHRAVREGVGLFDLSHLGKLDVVGGGAFEALQGLLTNDLRTVEVGRAQYHHLLNDAGGVREDLFVYRLGPERWFVVPNASNTSVVSSEISAAGAEVLDHDDWCFLGVQGPRSHAVVGALCLFEAWLDEHFPDRKQRVLNRVRDMRGGRLNDSRFGSRMKGEGKYAEQMKALFDATRRKLGLAPRGLTLSTEAFRRPSGHQLDLL